MKVVFLIFVVSFLLIFTKPLCKETHASASAKARNAGISISSSGNCSDRNNPRCTSLEQIR
jgi:hypothetical protein